LRCIAAVNPQCNSTIPLQRQQKGITMKLASLLLTLGALIASPVFAAPATTAPTAAGAVTAVCKDGTSFSGESRKGACKGHKGVQTWGGDTTAAPAAKAAPMTAAPAAAAPKAAAKAAAITTPAAGGGAGKVWLNAKSNTYHCMGTKYYGKTKEGAYMTEAEAKAKGAHADHGKACK
jgi:hypothetical protein